MKTGGPSHPRSPRMIVPICRVELGDKLIQQIRNRETLFDRHIDLFSLRHQFINNYSLRTTIAHVLMEFEEDKQIGLLAKSILLELGLTIKPVSFPEKVEGMQLYFLARLYIMIGNKTEAENLLRGRYPREVHEVIMLLLKDPSHTVRANAPDHWTSSSG